ncbi:TIGR02449 family protein [Thioalkalivibrio thiocyanodenitrificans]|uniref:TIGR02449 family protein n=1 Tax=Thioalkalivibrio thiocyanodenitrificans TaxID=243063 RepID=UPI0018DD5D54|nr:TIGR02449 family protein [Thioalkalivibrio thiocyanodenitrificans]
MQDVAEQELRKLETRVNELIRTCERLKEENRLLREQQVTLATERSHLVEGQEQARLKVESMISRLKAMEHGV